VITIWVCNCLAKVNWCKICMVKLTKSVNCGIIWPILKVFNLWKSFYYRDQLFSVTIMIWCKLFNYIILTIFKCLQISSEGAFLTIFHFSQGKCIFDRQKISLRMLNDLSYSKTLSVHLRVDVVVTPTTIAPSYRFPGHSAEDRNEKVSELKEAQNRRATLAPFLRESR